MGADWIKVSKDTPKKPELAIMAQKLNISLGDAFLEWFNAYSWADSITANGAIPFLSLVDGDRLSGCLSGTFAALASKEVGWILEKTRGFSFRKWDRHNGECAKRRALDSEKKRKQRKTPSPKCPESCGTKSGPDETRREKTDSVRPFVAADHAEVWPAARETARLAAKKLWPGGRTVKPDDRELLLKVAFLAKAVFSDEWFADAIGGAIAAPRKGQKAVINRIAYAKRILANKASKLGYVLNDLCDAITIPGKPAVNGKPPQLTPATFGIVPKDCQIKRE
jgi:hypothetical protein